jgi:hypothetical protein
VPAWTGEIDVPDARLGYSVASAGDVNADGYDDVIAGAWYYSGPEPQEGRVYLWLGSAAGLENAPAWSFEADQAGALLGIACAGAGDVNGDGYDDVIVGSRYHHLTDVAEGRVWVFLGSASGLSAVPVWSEVGQQPDANFGWRVAGAGDVNGDGFGDVVVGAWEHDNGQYDEGRVAVYEGSPTGLPPSSISDCD